MEVERVYMESDWDGQVAGAVCLLDTNSEYFDHVSGHVVRLPKSNMGGSEMPATENVWNTPKSATWSLRDCEYGDPSRKIHHHDADYSGASEVGVQGSMLLANDMDFTNGLSFLNQSLIDPELYDVSAELKNPHALQENRLRLNRSAKMVKELNRKRKLESARSTSDVLQDAGSPGGNVSGRSTCNVCLGDESDCQISKCGHSFHVGCAMRWLHYDGRCPICRQQPDELIPLHSTSKRFGDPSHSSFNISDRDLQVIESLSDMSTQEDHCDMAENAHNAIVGGNREKKNAAVHGGAEHSQLTSHPLQYSESNEELLITSNSEGLLQTMVYDPMYRVAPQWVDLPEAITPTSCELPAANFLTVPSIGNHGIVPANLPIIAKKTEVPGNTLKIGETSQRQEAGMSGRAPVRIVPMAPTSSGLLRPLLQATMTCKCAGGCKNGRCPCVRNGGKCGRECKCASCQNPFGVLSALGVHIDPKNKCMLHNLGKLKNVASSFLSRRVMIPCACVPKQSVPLQLCANGYTCGFCQKTFAFSWCKGFLHDASAAAEVHCPTCRRCRVAGESHCGSCDKCHVPGGIDSGGSVCANPQMGSKGRDNSDVVKSWKSQGGHNEVEDVQGDLCHVQ